MENIIKSIVAERQYQEAKWGNDFDDTNTNSQWANYISHYANRNLIGVKADQSDEAFRESMVKVATLAVAAIQALDRRVI